MLRIGKRLAIVWSIAFLLLSVQAASAQNDPKLAFTDPLKADADFDFVGEYVGSLEAGMGGRMQIALQVVALGGGKFQGAFLMGGLPNEGWNKFAKIKVVGERNRGLVTLEGNPYNLSVDRTGVVTVRYVRGTWVVGQMNKVFRSSPTMGMPAPYDAIVMFDGKNTEHFKNGKMNAEGYLMSGTELKQLFYDYTMHLEFRTPYMPYARGQGRGNSGVYLQSRYEVQILDSFGLDGAINECGALYTYKRPDVNMALPPLTWQTYDIDFRAPKYDDTGRRTANARVTVKHNGVLVQDNVELNGPTGAGAAEGPMALPIKLQDHGNPVQFRNIWLIDHRAPKPCLPCYWICCGRRACLVCP